jgi:hypothetical protein
LFMKDSSATAAPPLIRRTIRKARLPPLIVASLILLATSVT